MDIGPVLLFCFIGAFIICVILMASEAWNKNLGLTITFGVSASVLSILVFGGTAYEVGYGHVTQKSESLATRLKTGMAYQLVSSAKDDANQVILVKKAGTSDFYALRVKEVPPEYFTLIDGKPVAVAPPAPLVGVK